MCDKLQHRLLDLKKSEEKSVHQHFLHRKGRLEEFIMVH